MANKLYDETSIQAIADAIRSINGSSDTYTVSEMAAAIEAIPQKTPYIMATGYQYVNTGLMGNRNLTFKFKMKILVNTPLPFAVLAGDWNVNAFLFQVGGAYPDMFNITYFVGQNSYVTVENLSHDEWHDIEVGPGYITVDGQTTTGTAGTHNNTEIKIFGLKTSWSELATVCVGTIEVYEDNTLIRKYVPMKDETTTSGYFYDEVNDVSYFSNSNVPLIYMEEASKGDEMHNYSETEQKVGTWIDGRPVYEKTVVLPSTIQGNANTWIDTNVSAEGADTIIDAILLSKNQDGVFMTVHDYCGATIGDNHFKFLCVRSTGLYIDGFIVRYVKPAT